MAQTKRKRRTKHRGTPAGTIQARGRTSRPPSPQERKKRARETAREQRLNKPPTWASSARRAALAAVLVFVFVFITYGGKHSSTGTRLGSALVLGLVLGLFYVPAGYYLELFLWRRRQAKKAAQK
jgi:Flp pilus assembly protein TadB